MNLIRRTPRADAQPWLAGQSAAVSESSRLPRFPVQRDKEARGHLRTRHLTAELRSAQLTSTCRPGVTNTAAPLPWIDAHFQIDWLPCVLRVPERVRGRGRVSRSSSAIVSPRFSLSLSLCASQERRYIDCDAFRRRLTSLNS